MITCLSSMATRSLLADLVQGHDVAVTSIGGVDAAKRVQAGEHFDVVVLAADAIDKLVAAGHLQQRVDLVRSPVALAVKAGVAHPDIGSEDALRAAVLAAESIGYSTGPSGTHLTKLFERWGIADAVAGRIVQAPPGVPVAQLVADGRAALGFQQLAELIHADGIDVLGTLPAGAAFITTFSAALGQAGSDAAAAADWLAHMTSAAAEPAIRRHGMEPA